MIQAPSTIHVAKREHFQSRVVPKRDAQWLPRLGLNPSTSLPLQPHFWLLPQLATAANIPGRCGLWCGANYLQALLDPITNPYLGPPSWLHPVTRKAVHRILAIVCSVEPDWVQILTPVQTEDRAVEMILLHKNKVLILAFWEIPKPTYLKAQPTSS